MRRQSASKDDSVHVVKSSRNLLRPEPLEEEVDQRPAVEVGGPLVPVVPVRLGELAQGQPVASFSALLDKSCLLDGIVAHVGLGPALDQQGGRVVWRWAVAGEHAMRDLVTVKWVETVCVRPCLPRRCPQAQARGGPPLHTHERPARPVDGPFCRTPQPSFQGADVPVDGADLRGPRSRALTPRSSRPYRRTSVGGSGIVPRGPSPSRRADRAA